MLRRKTLSGLDKLRLDLNADQFKKTFLETANQNRALALKQINDAKLQFPSLFTLMPEIETLNLYEGLNSRNLQALKVCAKKLNKADLAAQLNQIYPNEASQESLNWMFQTGAGWRAQLYNNEYEAVLDAVTAILLKVYQDKNILPQVVELIFQRNQVGSFIHDLVWSFFQVFDEKALAQVADHLISDNKSEVKLAQNLLALPAPAQADKQILENQREQYLNWLKANSPFLYQSGESFQLTSEPKPLNLDLAAKYLVKKINYDREPLKPWTDAETRYVQRFKKYPPAEQKIMAEYSLRLHDQNKRLWKNWLRKRGWRSVKKN